MQHDQTELLLTMRDAPHSGTDTSRDAAADARYFAAKQRARVLAHLFVCGEYGATANEVESALGMSGNSVRPRLVELKEHGAAEQTTERRRTDSGRGARVWRAIK